MNLGPQEGYTECPVPSTMAAKGTARASGYGYIRGLIQALNAER